MIKLSVKKVKRLIIWDGLSTIDRDCYNCAFPLTKIEVWIEVKFKFERFHQLPKEKKLEQYCVRWQLPLPGPMPGQPVQPRGKPNAGSPWNLAH
jgi:hypothetical protein